MDDPMDIARPDFPIVVDDDPVALADTAKPAFSVLVSADRTTGTTSTTFNLTANVSSNDNAVESFTWRVNEGDPVASDAAAQLNFDEPGDYQVSVTVEDDSGQSVTDGVQLTVFDAESTSEDVTSQVTPDAGMPGTSVQIQSSSLNDPAILVEVMVHDGDPVEAFRPALGVANFMVPLDAADGLNAATEVMVTLIIDGALGESFAFTLSPLPALTDAPGALTRQWLESGSGILAGAQEDLFDAMAGLEADLTGEEIAFLQALLHYASVHFELVSDALLPLLDELDNDALTLLDHGLLANGVTSDSASQLILQAKSTRAGKNAKDLVVDQLCTFHDVIDDVLAFTNAVSKGALITPLAQLARSGAPLPPAVIAAANIAVDIGIVGDLLHELVKYVPRVGDSLDVQASPEQLMTESDKAVITIEATLITRVDPCEGGTAELLAMLISEATQRIFLNVPFAKMAFLAKNRTFFLRGDARLPITPANIQQFDSYFTKTLNTIAKAAVEATGVTIVFNDVRSKICALDDRRMVKLQPDTSVLTRSPSNAGTLLNLQDESVDFFCTLNDVGTVTFNVSRPCGIKGRVLTGQAQVNCFGETCMEDAIGSLEVTVIPGTVGVNDSFCTNIKESGFENRSAFIHVRNTHPTRTIRWAGVSYIESDKQDLPKGPCSEANLLPNQTLQDCLDSTGAGCDGPHGFIGPGEDESFDPIFTCLREGIYPGNGTCGDQELETETGTYIIQAVFCDDFDRQMPFCDAVNSFMKRQGEPSPLWSHREITECP